MYWSVKVESGLARPRRRLKFPQALLIIPSAADTPHSVNMVVFPENLLASRELKVVTSVKP